MRGDDLDTRRRRAAYRAGHRGTKEMDWLLGRYADANLADMDQAALDRFEQFLALPDPELHGWIVNPATIEGREFADLVSAVRRFHALD